MLPQTKACLGLPEAVKSKEGYPSGGFRQGMTLAIPWFQSAEMCENKFLLFKGIQFVTVALWS